MSTDHPFRNEVRTGYEAVEEARGVDYGWLTDAYMPMLRQQLAPLPAWARPPVHVPTRRERVAAWWNRNLPRVHRGPCNHDDCSDY